jgi:hypothetical protein
VSQEGPRDPREVLAREKFFTLRPQPLERWLWRQDLPPSAERVFWLHWQAGQRNGDWCSAIPLKAVAAECALDISSVTRAYQLLAQLGLIRRQDPGRDPERPFQQAVAVTEVRVPRELVQELARYPDRNPSGATAAVQPETTRAPETSEESASAAAVDPFQGLSGRARVRALGELLAAMSARERLAYDEALRVHRTHIDFDEDSKLSAEQRGTVLQFLAIVAPRPVASQPGSAPSGTSDSGPRRLTVFELARLRRELQQLVGALDAAERLREVVWSIEEGALRRFTTLHATRIALKKIREGAWTRPNRMPPKWMRGLSGTA